MTLILGIETSCDETSAAVIEETEGRITQRSLIIYSQDVHRLFGGVVPEIASRAHLTSIVPVVNQALTDAQVSISDIDAVAVTSAPGLIGALLVGVNYAKGISLATGIPMIAVHHMEGHLFAVTLEDASVEPPFTALLVSGGHTLLVDVERWGAYKVIGSTRDDAAGEAYDKVAKLLGLPYPGGRHVEELSKQGDPSRFRFSRPMVKKNDQVTDAGYLDVSFSGLKTAVLNAVRQSDNLDRDRADIARGFQDALVDTLAEKTFRAANLYGRKHVVLGGGVACNKTLASSITARLQKLGATVSAPTPKLATDNAAMIARAGLFRYNLGERSELDLSAQASAPLPGQL